MLTKEKLVEAIKNDWFSSEEELVDYIFRNIKEPVFFSEDDKDKLCPICGYSFDKNCQCLFNGTAHPDRAIRRRVVLDHLYLFSPEQVRHIIDLERHWQTSYSDIKASYILDTLEEKYSIRNAEI